MSSVLITEKLNVIYGELDIKVHALKDIDLQIEKGEIVAVVGPSGSGKSSLLHVLGAMMTPSSGTVHINGIPIEGMTSNQMATVRREHIGFVFQNFALIPNLNALDNVMTPLYPINPTWLRERATEILTDLGLKDRLLHKPNQLSGGERQRVAVARALINNPTIIFGDEITGNLDTKTGDEIFNLIRRINKEKDITFVLVTHDTRLASKCDRVISLEDGLIVK